MRQINFITCRPHATNAIRCVNQLEQTDVANSGSNWL